MGPDVFKTATRELSLTITLCSGSSFIYNVNCNSTTLPKTARYTKTPGDVLSNKNNNNVLEDIVPSGSPTRPARATVIDAAIKGLIKPAKRDVNELR